MKLGRLREEACLAIGYSRQLWSPRRSVLSFPSPPIPFKKPNENLTRLPHVNLRENLRQNMNMTAVHIRDANADACRNKAFEGLSGRLLKGDWPLDSQIQTTREGCGCFWDLLGGS